MATLAVRRILAAAVLIVLVTTGAFLLVHALPGEPGAIFEDARIPPAQAERVRAAWGLDRPLLERYVRFLAAAARGDWGPSLAQHRPAAAVIGEALPWTLLLALAALLVELGVGLGLGLLAARHPGGWLDHALRAASLTLRAMPGFWLALLLVAAFAVAWPLLPAGGTGEAGGGGLAAHLLLPALAAGLPAAAGSARFVRAALLEISGEPFLLAARARGLRRHVVLLHHELRAAAAPLLQVVGFSLGGLLSGSLAVEVVFAWPGLGRVTYDALLARDYPVLVAGAALAATAVVAGSVLAELGHAALDPRVRDD